MFERVGIFFPIIGWIATVELSRRRLQPAIDSIGEQLSRRGPTQPEVWGSEKRASFAEFFSKIVADELCWPNPYFIPDDPFQMLFIDDDGAGVAVMRAAEEYLSLPDETISEQRWAEMLRLTLGEAIDYMLALGD